MLDEVTIRHIKEAVEMCGYDFVEMMGNHTRKRAYTDIRAIVWSLCHRETGAMPGEIGRRFGWNRCTVHHSVNKAGELREYDKTFRDIYDSIYGYYMAIESYEAEFNEYPDPGTGEDMDGEKGRVVEDKEGTRQEEGC